jgi:hypothetical protein
LIRSRWYMAAGGWALLGLGGPEAGWAAEPLAGVLACRAITDATARLSCFDRESAGLEAKVAAAAVPVAVVPAPVAAQRPPPPPLDPKKEFGLPEKTVATQEVAAGTRAADTSAIDAHVLGFAQGADGRGVFTLDNGQIWRQVNSTGEMLIRNGDPVTISRAALGSYWLQAKSGRGCKVSRLR